MNSLDEMWHMDDPELASGISGNTWKVIIWPPVNANSAIMIPQQFSVCNQVENDTVALALFKCRIIAAIYFLRICTIAVDLHHRHHFIPPREYIGQIWDKQ